MRHGSRRSALLAAGLVSLALLTAGCSKSASQEPTASQSGTAGSPRASGMPTSGAPTSSAPTSSAPSSSSGLPAPLLAFDPKSAGRHSQQCIQVSGSDPVDYVYYPVIVTDASPVTLDDLSVTYVDGVQVAGSWVAPAPADAQTGLVQGWPAPSILTQSSSVQWSQKVVAKGATLAAGTPYNVFLHLRVYPDALPYTTKGVVLTYHDGAGTHTDTWVAQVTYQAGKC
jgi:hypothetical protein